jgi:hypothetical protein
MESASNGCHSVQFRLHQLLAAGSSVKFTSSRAGNLWVVQPSFKVPCLNNGFIPGRFHFSFRELSLAFGERAHYPADEIYVLALAIIGHAYPEIFASLSAISLTPTDSGMPGNFVTHSLNAGGSI